MTADWHTVQATHALPSRPQRTHHDTDLRTPWAGAILRVQNCGEPSAPPKKKDCLHSHA